MIMAGAARRPVIDWLREGIGSHPSRGDEGKGVLRADCALLNMAGEGGQPSPFCCVPGMVVYWLRHFA